MSISNPHDKIFKEVESVKENALDLLQAFLPADIAGLMDFSTLELDNQSYTDEKLRAFFSDLVYSCRLHEREGELRIALLFEHKSYRPAYPHLQLLRYMLTIWQENLKQKVALKIVIPIIFYHGKKDYEYQPLASYFPVHDNRLQQFIPDFTYILVNFESYSDRQIKEQFFKRDSNKVLVLFMKHIFDKEYIRHNLGDILKIGVFYYTTEEGEKFFFCILQYIFLGAEGVDPKTIIEEVQKAIPGGGRIAMTAGEKLIKEGRKEGLEEKARETARKMLKKGYPLAEIAELTGLDLETITSLEKERA